MKRVSGKYFALFIVFALCLSLMPSAFASETDSGTCGDNLTWSLSDTGILTVSGTGKMEEYSEKAAAPWEIYKPFILGVKIEAGVTDISDFAFAECSALVSVTIPEGLESIGAFAFFNCDSLTELIAGTGVKSIGDAAFFSCDSLTGITLPAGVESIGNVAFSDCVGLTGAAIPVSVTVIGIDVFSGCTALKDIYYSGTQEQWNAIKIDEHNETLKATAMHFTG